MILDRIQSHIAPGTVIPKPAAKAAFKVKGWGIRRGTMALIYTIPNHTHPNKPYNKGITAQEFEAAWVHLQSTGVLSRAWFNANLAACAREGSCNFTTIGGIFESLGIARYAGEGRYVLNRGAITPA